MRDFYVFLHVCTIKNYQKIFDELWEKSMPMINDSKKTFISIVGPYRLKCSNLPDNVNLIYHNENPITHKLPTFNAFMRKSLMGNHNVHEFPTLNLIKKTCQNHKCHVCYYHLKGVTITKRNHPVNDQRRYMTYFNIENYKTCIDFLKKYDAVGVDLLDWPFKHFSGNFWWSRSEHINNLPIIKSIPTVCGSERHKCEFWIGSIRGKYYCFHNSGIPPLQHPTFKYKPSEYKIL
jgi:hypothetical protein